MFLAYNWSMKKAVLLFGVISCVSGCQYAGVNTTDKWISMPGTYRYDQYGNRIWYEDKGYYTATGEFVETATPKGKPNYYELSDEEKKKFERNQNNEG